MKANPAPDEEIAALLLAEERAAVGSLEDAITVMRGLRKRDLGALEIIVRQAFRAGVSAGFESGRRQ